MTELVNELMAQLEEKLRKAFSGDNSDDTQKAFKLAVDRACSEGADRDDLGILLDTMAGSPINKVALESILGRLVDSGVSQTTLNRFADVVRAVKAEMKSSVKKATGPAGTQFVWTFTTGAQYAATGEMDLVSKNPGSLAALMTLKKCVDAVLKAQSSGIQKNADLRVPFSVEVTAGTTVRKSTTGDSGLGARMTPRAPSQKGNILTSALDRAGS